MSLPTVPRRGCPYRFGAVPDVAFEAKRCVRPEGHDGHHWTTMRKPTAKDIDWLAALEGVTILGFLKGSTRAFNRLADKGLMHKFYGRARTERGDWTYTIKATARGRALLARKDVR